MLNICMIGHGMMGRWHSATLKKEEDCRLHTLVGRRPEPTAAFAKEHGYTRWTTDLASALADSEIDIFVVASPSEDHAEMTIRCLDSGRHTLCEIPMGMSLGEAKAMVDAAAGVGRKLGIVYPMRMMPEMLALFERVKHGQERIRSIAGRFFIARWENVGATGYRRSWTDNLLWHHLGHLLDFALWMADAEPVFVTGFMPAPDRRTGTPMEAFIGVGTNSEQMLTITGSYAAHRPVCDTTILTDRDTYRIDAMMATLETGSGTIPLPSEEEDCAAALRDFLNAIRHDREPAIAGHSVLPMMAVLQRIQDDWDRRMQLAAIPGRGGARA